MNEPVSGLSRAWFTRMRVCVLCACVCCVRVCVVASVCVVCECLLCPCVCCRECANEWISTRRFTRRRRRSVACVNSPPLQGQIII